MEFKELRIKGTYEIIHKPLEDERGFFMRTYDDKLFNEAGLNYRWVQENQSSSLKKGIIRGLHFQKTPFSETKLVRCIKGTIFDVFVDLRKKSETFGQWDFIELSEDNFKAVLIPKGFAHGFCTLENNCTVLYKVDNYYSPLHETGIMWNDDDLKIDWPEKIPILSEKDRKNITFREFRNQLNTKDE